ncbi:MAG TPA: hypothetical protein VNN25_28100 [Thermoanaerobaculia bacterium]|nr:hypothetical protein [Thermoanaerobaculia bacterium]
MDVHVGEMNSTVRVGDSGGLSAETFQRIVDAVLARAREELARDARVKDELRLRTSASEQQP